MRTQRLIARVGAVVAALGILPLATGPAHAEPPAPSVPFDIHPTNSCELAGTAGPPEPPEGSFGHYSYRVDVSYNPCGLPVRAVAYIQQRAPICGLWPAPPCDASLWGHGNTVVGTDTSEQDAGINASNMPKWGLQVGLGQAWSYYFVGGDNGESTQGPSSDYFRDVPPPPNPPQTAPPPIPPAPNPNGTPEQTWGTNVHIRSQPNTSSQIVATLPAPTKVNDLCQSRGEDITADGYTNDMWSYLGDYKGWISNIYLEGPAVMTGVPACPPDILYP